MAYYLPWLKNTSASVAMLTWTPPTQDQNSASLTPTNHTAYASLFSDDWAGGISQATGSALGSYNWTHASFTGGTTWYFWVRAFETDRKFSLPIYCGSKTF